FGKVGELAPAPPALAPIAPLPVAPATSLPGAPFAGSPSPFAAAPTAATRSGDLVTVNFEALSGSANEARSLAALLPGARVLTQEQATEGALKLVHSPSVLHIATHGFFL